MLERFVVFCDKALKTLTHMPASDGKQEPFKKSIPMKRVNYAGEIAAQGLYMGAWLAEDKEDLQQFYLHAAAEEYRHLDWCGARVSALGGKVSVFNPIWYAGGSLLGFSSRMLGSSYALGFVEETERQVLEHLRGHLHKLPIDDVKSRSVVEQMIIEEQEHGDHAAQLGAATLPKPVCQVMHFMGRVLTTISAEI